MGMNALLKLPKVIVAGRRFAMAFATALCACGVLASSGPAWSDEPSLWALEDFGKRLFFTKISDPPRQACASCHDPAAGGTNENSRINDSNVAVISANPHAPNPDKMNANGDLVGHIPNAGNRRPQTNMYVGFFVPKVNPATWEPYPCDSIDVVGDGTCGRPIHDFDDERGGAFWDGRATGEVVAAILGCTQNTNGTATHSDDTFSDCTYLPWEFEKFLGPIADQAHASPFFNPKEQALPDDVAVCQFVANTKWGPDLYDKAFGYPLSCDADWIDVTFAQFSVALADYQMSKQNNRFDSFRDYALAGDAFVDPDTGETCDDTPGKFPLCAFSGEQNLGHDLFYGENDSGNTVLVNTGEVDGENRPILEEQEVNAACDKCHSVKPRGVVRAPFDEIDDGTEPFQIYTDFNFHNLGLFTNPEMKTLPGPDLGLVKEDRNGNLVQCGEFSTTGLRNLTKKPNKNFVKAYMHNGIFKDLWQVVHYYNTRNFDRVDCPVFAPPYDNEGVDGPTGNGCLRIGRRGGLLQPKYHDVVECEDRPEGWTADEAIAENCWPKPEVPNCIDVNSGVDRGASPIGTGIGAFGNLGLSPEDEKAIASYLETLDDTTTVQPPTPYQAPGQQNKPQK
jgi:cytochrome c peroxidase